MAREKSQNTPSILLRIENVRDDAGYWTQIEAYIARHAEAAFSHGICPDGTRPRPHRAAARRYSYLLLD